MATVALEHRTRSSSFSVILMKRLRVPTSLHLQSTYKMYFYFLFCYHFVLAILKSVVLFRYSSINEINKITQENKRSKVFVYFITRLPRIEGGTSYIGFHGGKTTTNLHTVTTIFITVNKVHFL